MKQIIPKDKRWRTLRIFNSPNKEMFFEVTKKDILKKHNNNLWDYLVVDMRNEIHKKGIYYMDVINDNIFKIGYNHNEITEEEVIKFASSLKL